ncbi:MAG: hypothetical protein M0Q15_15815 [Nevskia sp.]|jgi:hypothetical protein|nr:hypothetical protein [Nevskia sp.]
MANPITRIILSAVDRTKAAFASAKGGINSLGESATGVSGILRNLFAGFTVVYFIGKLKGVVDTMVEVKDAAAQAGTSVENLTALQFAGKMTGVEDMQKSLVALVAGLAAAKTGTGPVAEAFATLKIDPNQFTDPADALEALADRFALLPDGVTKTSLAIDIFGKRVGPGLIPLLNESGEGVRRFKEEAGALGKVMSTEAIEAADKFGDNLDRLKEHAAGAAQGGIGILLPSLNQYLSAMDDVIQKGSALDKIRFFGFGNINPDTLDRITSATDKLSQAREKLAAVTDGASRNSLRASSIAAEQRALIKLLEEQIAVENKAAAAKKENAKAAEDDVRKADAAKESKKEIAASLKESVNEQISDAKRLQSALQSAFSESTKAEEDYLKQAKKLRAEANGGTVGDGPEAQALAALEATIAAMKLQRTASTESLDSVQQQAEALRTLADGIEDVSKKESLRRQANLAEATALERAAADERARYQSLSQQQDMAAAQSEKLKASLDGIGKEVKVDIKPGPQTQQLISDLDQIIAKIGVINTTPVSPGAGASGYASSMSEALRTEALKRGNRR